MKSFLWFLTLISVSSLFSQSFTETNVFSLNTATWEVSAPNLNGGTVTGVGQVTLDTTTVLEAVPDAGYLFNGWDSGIVAMLLDEALLSESSVSVLSTEVGDRYIFNGLTEYQPARKFVVSDGSYTLKDIPYSNPLAVVNAGKSTEINYAADNTQPIEIKVSGGSQTAPFYTFTDADGNDLTAAFDGGYFMMRGRTYRFVADGISANHPFMVNTGRFDLQADWVTGSPIVGTGEAIEVTLPTTYTSPISFYCTVHSTMTRSMNPFLAFVDGALYDFYWGRVNVQVSGDFGAVSVQSFSNGALGGEDLFVYDDGSYFSLQNNPITILVDGDKAVSPSFIQDTSDLDGDGLTAYEELALYGTDPAIVDTDGDGYDDYAESVTYESDPLDIGVVPTYQLSVTQEVYGSISGSGLIEINTSGTLTAIPQAGYAFAGWTGDATGNDNPLSVLMNTDKTIGADFISTTNLSRIQQEARSVVLADPSSYNLISADLVSSGLSLGGIRISGSGQEKDISFTIETSTDLGTWTVEETINRQLQLPASGPIFMRVGVPDENE
jgi:uncharacterized repeat protein (TIGR02543 family)